MSESSISGFSSVITSITKRIGQSVAWLSLFMVVLMTLVVVLRYGFNLGWIWLQESVLYFHAFLLMLAMAYTLLMDEHVRVDIFYRRFTAKDKNKVNLIGHIFFLIPTCLFILFVSWNYVAQSWTILEGSQEAGGLPLVYLLKSLLVVAPLLMIFQAVAQIIEILVSAKGDK